MAIKPHKKLFRILVLLEIAISMKLQFCSNFSFSLNFNWFYCHMITTKVLRSYLTFAKQAFKKIGFYLHFEKKMQYSLDRAHKTYMEMITHIETTFDFPIILCLPRVSAQSL